ncbi:putative PEP-binding protein [Paenibacillus sp. DMB20]|uniref:putative PEP-binding protein n=1 Tax=Paenibacillus sp. DMB20 TaxID=1642570 RepID=UPI000627F063|nr:putative PEP-binding protein [Paenibacillus sp. DMB20]KKO53057.1 hypothetical protein XI25_15220 [Paenibacillus sp. DMB20]
MTEGKRANGAEIGKRFYDIFNRTDRDRPAEKWGDIQVLNDLAAKGGMTHEEALLLLATPDDIEEVMRKKDSSGKESASLQRLLSWSDEKRKLKVLARADDPVKAAAGMREGAQGIGLIRGEALLRSGDRLLEVYADWIKNRDEEKRQHMRFRLVSLWTEEWTKILQAAKGAPCAVSLAWDVLEDGGPEERLELQDIQLESLFRAAARCQEEGTECRLEVLALWPMDAADFTAAHDFVEEVGQQMMGALRHGTNLKIGALLHPDVLPSDAGDVTRLADVIVIDTECASKFHLVDERNPLEGPARMNMSEPVQEWASPALLYPRLEETILKIRRVKPEIRIRAGGQIKAGDLRTVYRLGMTEVCCAPEDLAAVRLTGLRLEMVEGRYSSAEEA